MTRNEQSEAPQPTLIPDYDKRLEKPQESHVQQICSSKQRLDCKGKKKDLDIRNKLNEE